MTYTVNLIDSDGEAFRAGPEYATRAEAVIALEAQPLFGRWRRKEVRNADGKLLKGNDAENDEVSDWRALI